MEVNSKKEDALLGSDENRRMFDEIVPRYDLLNHLMSMGLDCYWRSKAVQALAPEKNGFYFDVGCGTGDLCIKCLRCSPDCRTLGIDQSDGMLERARQKTQALGLNDSASFEPGDVCALSYDDCMFDGVISGFCIRNVTDRKAAFMEMLRVTRPAGRIILLELTLPKRGFVRICHKIYNRCVVKPLGFLLSRGTAYRYLADSIQAFPESLLVAEEMRQAGMTDVSVRPLSLGVVTLFTARKAGGDESGGMVRS